MVDAVTDFVQSNGSGITLGFILVVFGTIFMMLYAAYKRDVRMALEDAMNQLDKEEERNV